MRIALVSPSFRPAPGALERHVEMLARGLARRGADVEVFTQGQAQAVEHCDGVTVRRYATAVGPLRFAVAPKLWDRLRLTADAFDVVDVHTRQPQLVLAVARARVRRLVFTPRAPTQRFLEWPYVWATRAVVGAAAHIVCSSVAERDLLCRSFPQAARRMHVIPVGVDHRAIEASTPFSLGNPVALAVGRLERSKSLDRAIAAMAGADRDLRLVVVGDGPARHWLRAYAADLRVASRVDFVGPVRDATLYRWLRTARVVLALARHDSSGSQVAEALAADATVVASDIPVHREAARLDRDSVVFVSPEGSPLEVADAIEHAARSAQHSGARPHAAPWPSWNSVVDDTWQVYERLAFRALRSGPPRDAAGTRAVATGPGPGDQISDESGSGA